HRRTEDLGSRRLEYAPGGHALRTHPQSPLVPGRALDRVLWTPLGRKHRPALPALHRGGARWNASTFTAAPRRYFFPELVSRWQMAVCIARRRGSVARLESTIVEGQRSHAGVGPSHSERRGGRRGRCWPRVAVT